MMMMTMMTNITPYWRTKTHIWEKVLMGIWASAILIVGNIIVLIIITNSHLSLYFIIISFAIVAISSHPHDSKPDHLNSYHYFLPHCIHVHQTWLWARSNAKAYSCAKDFHHGGSNNQNVTNFIRNRWFVVIDNVPNLEREFPAKAGGYQTSVFQLSA